MKFEFTGPNQILSLVLGLRTGAYREHRFKIYRKLKCINAKSCENLKLSMLFNR